LVITTWCYFPILVLGSFPKDIDVLGYKHNITDIDATLGLVGLKYLDRALDRRREIAKLYVEELGKLENAELPIYGKRRLNSYWMFPILVQERNSFAKFMRKKGIEVSKHNERNDKYKIFGGLREDLPNTARVDKRIVHIPIHASLTEKEVTRVTRKIKEWDRSC